VSGINATLEVLPNSRTAKSGSIWIASCRWNGRAFEARSRNGASFALCRQLVAARCPDQALRVYGPEGRLLQLTFPSIHRAAGQTVIEGSKTPISHAPLQGRSRRWHRGGWPNRGHLAFRGTWDSPTTYCPFVLTTIALISSTGHASSRTTCKERGRDSRPSWSRGHRYHRGTDQVPIRYRAGSEPARIVQTPQKAALIRLSAVRRSTVCGSGDQDPVTAGTEFYTVVCATCEMALNLHNRSAARSFLGCSNIPRAPAANPHGA